MSKQSHNCKHDHCNILRWVFIWFNFCDMVFWKLFQCLFSCNQCRFCLFKFSICLFSHSFAFNSFLLNNHLSFLNSLQSFICLFLLRVNLNHLLINFLLKFNRFLFLFFRLSCHCQHFFLCAVEFWKTVCKFVYLKSNIMFLLFYQIVISL